jgi:hypothetical protein
MPKGVPKNGVNKGWFKKGNIPWCQGKKRPDISLRQIGAGNHMFGKTSWSKGLTGIFKHSKETKIRMSKVHKGLNTWMKGKKLSEETKRKIGLSSKGRKVSMESRKKNSLSKTGSKNPMWKGGITPNHKKIRNLFEIKLWRDAVLARDNYLCQKCNIGSDKLNAHHIKNFIKFLELRTSIENGITLCEKCHIKFHKIYGKTNNTKEQIDDFIINVR